MIKNIIYKEKKYPIRISYYALKMIKEEFGKSLEELGDSDYKVYESLLFYSLQQGHKVTGEKLELKKGEMEDVMDEIFFDFLRMIPEFFPKNPIPIPPNPNKKVKVVKK